MKFERPEKGRAKDWVEDSLPLCPFCGSSSGWEIARDSKWKLTAKLLRHYFRCTNPNCMVILSIPNPVMVSKKRAVASLGLTGLAIKKKVGTKVRVDSPGNSDNAKPHAGEEYALEILQDWAKRTANVPRNI